MTYEEELQAFHQWKNALGLSWRICRFLGIKEQGKEGMNVGNENDKSDTPSARRSPWILGGVEGAVQAERRAELDRENYLSRHGIDPDQAEDERTYSALQKARAQRRAAADGYRRFEESVPWTRSMGADGLMGWPEQWALDVVCRFFGFSSPRPLQGEAWTETITLTESGIRKIAYMVQRAAEDRSSAAKKEGKSEAIREIMDNPDIAPTSLAGMLRAQGMIQGLRRAREIVGPCADKGCSRAVAILRTVKGEEEKA